MLAAVAPLPTARLELPAGASTDPRKEWEATREAFERDLLAWRSSFLGHLAAMRSALEQSVEEIGAEQAGNIHHPNFGRHLKKVMDQVGIYCEFHLVSDFPSQQARADAMLAFLKKNFAMQPKAPGGSP